MRIIYMIMDYLHTLLSLGSRSVVDLLSSLGRSSSLEGSIAFVFVVEMAVGGNIFQQIQTKCGFIHILVRESKG